MTIGAEGTRTKLLSTNVKDACIRACMSITCCWDDRLYCFTPWYAHTSLPRPLTKTEYQDRAAHLGICTWVGLQPVPTQGRVGRSAHAGGLPHFCMYVLRMLHHISRDMPVLPVLESISNRHGTPGPVFYRPLNN